MHTRLVEQFCWCHDPTALVCYQYTKYHQILWGSISKLVYCLERITLNICERKTSYSLSKYKALVWPIYKGKSILHGSYDLISVLTSFGIQSNSEELDLPYIYWVPKMHKNPYKHRFIAGSSKYSTKPLSILLTKLLKHIEQGLEKYCETAYSRSGVNQMWILKELKRIIRSS